MEPLFPATPEDISALSDDALAELRAECVRIADAVLDGDESVIDGRSDEEVDAEMERGAELVKAVRSEQEGRDEAAAERKEKREQLRAEMGDTEDAAEGEDDKDEKSDESKTDEGDGAEKQDGTEVNVEVNAEGEGDEAEAEKSEEREAVTAAGGRSVSTKRRLPASNSKRGPGAEEKATGEVARAAILAAADTQVAATGAGFKDRLGVAEAMLLKHRQVGRNNIGRGRTALSDRRRDAVAEVGLSDNAQWIPVATMHTDYPDERTLTTESPEGNDEKIKAVTGRQAITAAGGLCAPVEIRYDIDVYGDDSMPVHEMLPNFGASRGGLRFTPPISAAVVVTTGAAGSAMKKITAAADLAGGAGATKPCQIITCPSFTEIDVGIVSRCFRFSNLPARTYPELVDAWMQAAGVAFASVRETAYLDAIVTASTAGADAALAALGVAGTAASAGQATIIGAYSEFIPTLIKAAASFRSRYRDPDMSLDVVLPIWLPDLLNADLQRSMNDRWEYTREQIAAYLATVANVRVTWYLDGPTSGTGQVLAGISGGNIPDFPANVQWGMFPTGSFLNLDGGQLDMGVVRDSTLNATNEFTMFMEVFENIAFVGLESWWVTSVLADTGATGGIATIPAAG